MPLEQNFSMSRFLSSKKTVDDRALNKDVVERLKSSLKLRSGRPKVLEIGAGLGTMIERMYDWNVLTEADYIVLDLDPVLVKESAFCIRRWAKSEGFTCHGNEERLEIEASGGARWNVDLVCRELGDYLAEKPDLSVDLLIANAFLDLTDVDSILDDLFQLCAPDGLYWFSINFDGESIFCPEHPDDSLFLGLYHQSMDCRVRFERPAGDSRTGRHLFSHLQAKGASILQAGSSDWVVFPQDGRYLQDESYFLHHIIHTISEELKTNPEAPADRLSAWVELRHRQIEDASLVYIAHQLDFVGHRPNPAGSH